MPLRRMGGSDNEEVCSATASCFLETDRFFFSFFFWKQIDVQRDKEKHTTVKFADEQCG